MPIIKSAGLLHFGSELRMGLPLAQPGKHSQDSNSWQTSGAAEDEREFLSAISATGGGAARQDRAYDVLSICTSPHRVDFITLRDLKARPFLRRTGFSVPYSSLCSEDR